MESQGMSRPPRDGAADAVSASLLKQNLRYVVLHHTGSGEGDHFDFMLEVPGNERLLTWRVMTPPQRWGGDIAAKRIADHRKAYLTYEGEISGGRGRVERVREGTASVISVGHGEMEVVLSGSAPAIRLRLAAG
jgi:hypothetical protein